MKLHKISLALMLGFCMLTSCSDKLEVTNPNQPTTGTFGNTVDDLEEAVIACYHHIRMEGTFARVGYTLDAVRGDEVWNSAQGWGYYLADKLSPSTTDEIYALWSWRDWYYVINICNFVITKCNEEASLSTAKQRIKEYDRVMDQVEADFAEALSLLPSKTEGGEWAKGRATKGAAAGFYARALMQRHKYSEALPLLERIINKEFGEYKLMSNYGDNFREGSAYENNAESLFEVQFLDYGTQGPDDEWTPVNISKNASQGHAVESNFGPGDFGGWADLSAAPWLYHLFVDGDKTKNGRLDPRLYWTIGTYEADWDTYKSELGTLGNVCYNTTMTEDAPVVTNNNNGGLPIAKWTNMRTGLYSTVVVGLKCGINLRLMRYSDVLLRAAECENEINGPTQRAIDWINEVRQRAQLNDLSLADFDTKDKLFEQIANVERPKEFGCEYGRGLDLQRWGFFYDSKRMDQMKQHSAYKLSTDKSTVKNAVKYGDSGVECSFSTYLNGHEYYPIWQTTLNNNPNLVGNSANETVDNSFYFSQKGWTIHPVVDLSK